MRVLVACEESHRVCTAFRERGHIAYSCDIQEPSGGHPEWHIEPYVCTGSGKPGVSRAGGAAKTRSKTFEGIAQAMAEQWGGTEND